MTIQEALIAADGKMIAREEWGGWWRVYVNQGGNLEFLENRMGAGKWVKPRGPMALSVVDILAKDWKVI